MTRGIPAFFLFIPWCAAVAAAGPMLTITPDAIAFGNVREGTVPEATLSVRNSGDAPAQIQRFQSSCPCILLPELSEAERVIAPGEQRDYTIRYNTAGYRGERGATIALTADDATSPHLITVSIDIQSALRILPRTVHWARARPGTVYPESIAIAAADPGKPVELVRVQGSQALLHVSGQASTVEGQPAIAVSLTLDESAPVGPLSAAIDATVRVDGVEHSVQIPVTVNVVGDFLFYPPAVISVDRPILRGTRLSEITIVPSEDARVSVLDVSVTGPIRADLPEPESAEKMVIPIFIAPDAPPGPQAGKVTVITTSRELPMVSVPVYFETLPPVTVEPATVVLAPAAASRKVSLRSTGEDLMISDPKSTLEGVSAAIVTAAQQGADPASIEIRLDSDAPAAGCAGSIHVTTNIPGMETVTIPVAIESPAE
jgi:hypothetical protein